MTHIASFNDGIEAAAKRLREISHEGLKASWWRERFESAARSVEALKRPEPSEADWMPIETAPRDGTKTLLFKGEHGDVRIELPTEQAVVLTRNILDYLLDVTLASVSAGALLGLEVFDKKGELTDRVYNAGVMTVRQQADRLFAIE